MLVSQILKRKSPAIVTVAPDARVAEAVAILSEKRIGALIVSTGGQDVLGILSERDIVRELGRQGAGFLSSRVDAVMTGSPVGCAPGDTALSVLQRMTEGRFRHMPVMEGDRMVGLISIGDVVKARLDELDAERDALEGMIKGF